MTYDKKIIVNLKLQLCKSNRNTSTKYIYSGSEFDQSRIREIERKRLKGRRDRKEENGESESENEGKKPVKDGE